MSRGFIWDEIDGRGKIVRTSPEEAAKKKAAESLSRLDKNRQDLVWLKTLLRHPGLDIVGSTGPVPNWVRRIERSISYLNRSQSPLHPTWRKAYSRYEDLLSRAAAGDWAPPKTKTPRKTRSIVNNAGGEDWIPAWMKDPSLLPKKPPGRV